MAQDYNSTINLPKTEFPMRAGLPKREPDMLAAWENDNLYALLMAKNIDGVYSADPKLDPSAVRYDEITYKEVISKELKALDLSAATFCMENDITVYAFGLKDPMNIYRAVMGEKIGTELHK